RSLRNAIIAEAFGYRDVMANRRSRRAAKLLSLLGPLREMAGRYVMYLRSEHGRLLDVGCGNGVFIAGMRRLGWEVAGVDPDPAGVEAARERDLDVEHATLEDAHFPDASFDVLTMSHVIEHVPDPEGTLRECLRVLRPGGQLVIATPNVDSLGRRRFGSDWLGWSIPYHLLVFASGPLREAVERSGFLIKRVMTAASIAGEIRYWSALMRRGEHMPRMTPSLRHGLAPRGIPFWLLEYGLSRFGPFGEEIFVMATKPNAPA
ncbi:MAG: class I SAM-dependent methyltransferase, partial [Actinomycetota bacterium]